MVSRRKGTERRLRLPRPLIWHRVVGDLVVAKAELEEAVNGPADDVSRVGIDPEGTKETYDIALSDEGPGFHVQALAQEMPGEAVQRPHVLGHRPQGEHSRQVPPTLLLTHADTELRVLLDEAAKGGGNSLYPCRDGPQPASILVGRRQQARLAEEDQEACTDRRTWVIVAKPRSSHAALMAPPPTAPPPSAGRGRGDAK